MLTQVILELGPQLVFIVVRIVIDNMEVEDRVANLSCSGDQLRQLELGLVLADMLVGNGDD